MAPVRTLPRTLLERIDATRRAVHPFRALGCGQDDVDPEPDDRALRRPRRGGVLGQPHHPPAAAGGGRRPGLPLRRPRQVSGDDRGGCLPRVGQGARQLLWDGARGGLPAPRAGDRRPARHRRARGPSRWWPRVPDAQSIFVLHPSYEDLERRLRSRALDDDRTIARRLSVSLGEVRRYDQYRYVIINDDARRASEALAAIILEKRYRRERMQSRLQEILSDFQVRSTDPPL